ncbi:MAG: site-specific integrase [Planctomycetes bacterium]|nr:site-specific integrase [Planctomycetota bacterium]
MSRTKSGTIPTYRHHKARNLAVVTVDGHDYYLGTYGSPDSHRRYEALVRSWRERQDDPEPSANQLLVPTDRPSVNELILAYLKFVKQHYKLYHGRNKEAACVSDALAAIQECGYGPEPADAFRPKDLKKVRDCMIAKNWSRGYLNHQVIRIKRMFAYAVEEDMVPGSVYHGLLAIKGLRKGTPGVREAGKVKPVPTDDVKAVLKKANRMIKAMVLFAWYTGARPGEVCALKPCYLDTGTRVWTFSVPPDSNKTDVHDQERTIYVGPKAQKVLKVWLKNIEPHEYVFSPIREAQLRQAARAAARKTKPTPSELRKKEERKRRLPKRCKRDHYDPNAFRQAVVRLCDAAGVSRWSPNRLRHNAGTRFRRKYGIEVARILLGHSRVSTSEIYAAPNAKKAMKAALDMG